MKPKKSLTKCKAKIIIKNPFKGTLMSWVTFGEEASPEYMAEQMHDEIQAMKFDYVNFDWTEWFRLKKMKGWGKLKCFNCIDRWFELTEKDRKILETHAKRAGLIRVSLIGDYAQ